MGKTGRRGTGRYRWKFLSGTFIMDFTFGLALVRDMNGGNKWISSEVGRYSYTSGSYLGDPLIPYHTSRAHDLI